MRIYPGFDNWPEDATEAHKMVINAGMHLKNRELVEFETLEARVILNNAQVAVNAALQDAFIAKVAKMVAAA